MAIDGKYAKSNFVLARGKGVQSHGQSFWIVGAYRHVTLIDAFAARVGDSQRREAGLELLVEPELDLRGSFEDLRSLGGNRFDERGVRKDDRRER
jgi:hypothetical protein